MIDISLGKLLLLAVVALIVLGPERLPHAARTAGALLRRIRNGWESVRTEVEREIQAEEIKRTLRETADNARAAHDQRRARTSAPPPPISVVPASASATPSLKHRRRAPRAGEPDPAVDMLPLKHGEPTPSGNEHA